MNVASFFSNFLPGGAPAAQPAPGAPAQQVPPTGQIPASAQQAGATTASAATAANGVVPAGAAIPPTPESKVEPFKDLWENVQTPQQGQPIFTSTKEQLLELARKQDFKPQLTQEQVQAIAAGGPEAVSAMMEAMNDMTQRVYAQNAHATTQLIEAAAKKMNDAAAASMQNAISTNAVKSSLQSANPLLANPAVAPLVDMATKQLTAKHPTANPSEISAMVNSYISGLAEVFTAPQQQAAQQQQATAAAAKDEDWTKFFGM